MSLEIKFNEATNQYEIAQHTDPIMLISAIILFIMILFFLRSFLRFNSINRNVKEINATLKAMSEKMGIKQPEENNPD